MAPLSHRLLRLQCWVPRSRAAAGLLCIRTYSCGRGAPPHGPQQACGRPAQAHRWGRGAAGAPRCRRWRTSRSRRTWAGTPPRRRTTRPMRHLLSTGARQRRPRRVVSRGADARSKRCGLASPGLPAGGSLRADTARAFARAATVQLLSGVRAARLPGAGTNRTTHAPRAFGLSAAVAALWQAALRVWWGGCSDIFSGVPVVKWVSMHVR